MHTKLSVAGYFRAMLQTEINASETEFASVANSLARESQALKKVVPNVVSRLRVNMAGREKAARQCCKLCRPQFTLRTALVCVSVIALLIGVTIVPRVRESMAISRFGEEGDVERSWVARRAPTYVDQILSFNGFVDAIIFRGDDPEFQSQLEASSQLRKLQEVSFQSVGQEVGLRASFKLTSVRKVTFSYCQPDFVRDILERIPNVRSLEFYECMDLGDSDLRKISDLRRVQSISIDGCNVSGSFLDAVDTRTKLRSIELRYSPITLEGLNAISRLGDLDQLVIEFPTSDIERSAVEKTLRSTSEQSKGKGVIKALPSSAPE